MTRWTALAAPTPLFAVIAAIATGDGASRAANFTRIPAQLAMLALLGTAALGAALVAAGAYFALRSRPRLARLSLGAALALGGLYLAALFGFALASRDVTLAPGGEKYFCEADCHLAYAVEDVRRVDGDSADVVWTVVLRTRFDETTIAPWRPRDAPLATEPKRAWVADGAGRMFESSPAAGAALPPAGEAFTDPSTSLVPGASYRTRLAFVLPAGDRPERLLLLQRDAWTRLLVDHETSPFHGHVWFRLPS